MADQKNSSAWIHRFSKRPEPQVTDWGDLGTAFGMEMTLVSPTRVADKASKATVDKGQTPPRWWSRRR